jgi:hypothetical protein
MYTPMSQRVAMMPRFEFTAEARRPFTAKLARALAVPEEAEALASGPRAG